MHQGAVATLSRRGLPYANVMTHLASIYQILAGLLLTVGLFIAPVAVSLILFTVLASYLMLDFWNKQGPERMVARSYCLCNVAIVGALFVVTAYALR